MKLSAHQSAKFVKLIYIGDSGAGKTGSLESLIEAGYELGILDIDNGLDALKQWIMHKAPNAIDKVDFETLTDSIRAGQNGPLVDAKAYVAGVKLLTKWSDGSIPSEWGENKVLVVDSLTALGKAAFEWAKGMNPGAKDPRQWYFAAQQSIENIIMMLTSAEFKANVIVISHINYRELQDGTTKGYPSAVGSALGPTIPKYFNTLVMATTLGAGKNLQRRIQTIPTAVIDLKNPAPFKIEADYDLGTGMAQLFKQLKAL